MTFNDLKIKLFERNWNINIKSKSYYGREKKEPLCSPPSRVPPANGCSRRRRSRSGSRIADAGTGGGMCAGQPPAGRWDVVFGAAVCELMLMVLSL
jgi:hypothetical protein